MTRRSALLGFTLALVAVGCALTFAPGDYGGAADLPADGGPPATSDGAPTGDADPLPASDAGPGAARHLLVVAGERDGVESATSDVWSATIDARGELGELTYLPSGPVRGPRAALALAEGRLLVATRTSADRVVESAPFDGGASFSWQATPVANPGPAGFGQLFVGTALVSAGGATTTVTSDPEGNPVTVTTYETGIQLSIPDAGVHPRALTTSSLKLPTGLRDITFVPYEGIVFFWGNSDTPNQRSRMFAARGEVRTGLAAIVEQPNAILDPRTGAPHTPTAPIACAGDGRLFIVGGDRTDAVLTATIDGVNATLGPWKAGPPLPTTLKGAGCAVWGGRIFVIGGLAGEAAVRSDKIYTATVARDGTMGAWSTSPRTLPGARSNVFALTY